MKPKIIYVIIDEYNKVLFTLPDNFSRANLTRGLEDEHSEKVILLDWDQAKAIESGTIKYNLFEDGGEQWEREATIVSTNLYK